MLTITRLGVDEAHTLIAGARAKACALGVPMCIAVTDESGNLIAFERMNGAKIPSITIAIDKSYTASGTRKGTHELSGAVQPGQPAYGLPSSVGGRMLVIAGGLPVCIDSQVVGAIGVSSGSPDQDLAVAEAGLNALHAFVQTNSR